MLDSKKKVLMIEAGTFNKFRRCPVLFSGTGCVGCGGNARSSAELGALAVRSAAGSYPNIPPEAD
jgi:hypothetical protein